MMQIAYGVGEGAAVTGCVTQAGHSSTCSLSVQEQLITQ